MRIKEDHAIGIHACVQACVVQYFWSFFMLAETVFPTELVHIHYNVLGYVLVTVFLYIGMCISKNVINIFACIKLTA